jgi:hypothetical protein
MRGMFTLLTCAAVAPLASTAQAPRPSDRPPLFGYEQTIQFPSDSNYSVERITPAEHDFYSKLIYFEGIPIKAHESVENRALYVAHEKLSKLFGDFGAYRSAILANLLRHRVELHVIGRLQNMTDLPENRARKGERFEEFGGLTLDERSRGGGGRLVSCGEENLLALPADRYAGNDICIHEFAHAIRTFGLPESLRRQFDQQFENSVAKNLWAGDYAATNPDEFFAELTRRYFGKGRNDFLSYDPESFALFSRFYGGSFPLEDFLPVSGLHGK